MYTQNYEHFKRIIFESPDSEAEYIDGFNFELGVLLYFKSSRTWHRGVVRRAPLLVFFLRVISKEKLSDTVIFRMFIYPLRYYHNLEEE